MRILKIELTGVLRPKTEGIDLASDGVASQLYRELDQLRPDIAERIRIKAVALLPSEYAIFVRTSFERVGNKALVTFWIDDPSVAGVSGLLARRAWTLSIPILSHVFREAIQERLQTLVVDVDNRAARVASFAPTRAWYSPLVVGITAVFLSAVYWFVLHDAIVAAFRRLTG
jgi:hypothetical protein